MKLYIVHIITESSDHYYEVYNYKPNVNKIIKFLWEDEGKIESLDWYKNTTSVRINETTLIEKKK